MLLHLLRSKSLLIAALLVLFSGCSSAPHSDDHEGREAYSRAKAQMASQSDEVEPRKPNEIAPGYEIKLVTREDPHLNGKFRVEFDGRLKLPYEVVIKTDDMTIDRLHAAIVRAYEKYFKNPPEMNVSISEEKFWVDVRGLVEKPGRFLIKKSTSLDEVLAMAGGLRKNANVGYVKIQESKSATTIKLSDYYSGSPQDRIPPWRGGEILFFQTDRGQATATGDMDKSYIEFIGEVKTPGEYRYLEGADFYYYLVKAGGPTDRADMRSVRIIRKGMEGPRMIDFGTDHINELVPIEPGDIIFLEADKQTPTERAVPLITGLIGILNTVFLAILVIR
jgi:protein involved in polysaccharide export with SLBB domain